MTVHDRGRSESDRPPSALRETFPSGFNQARRLERQSIIADWFELATAAAFIPQQSCEMEGAERALSVL